MDTADGVLDDMARRGYVGVGVRQVRFRRWLTSVAVTPALFFGRQTASCCRTNARAEARADIPIEDPVRLQPAPVAIAASRT